MNINTKKYIEEFLKIKNKKSEIIPFKLNYPQQKLYDVIKQEKRLHKPVRIIILKARQMGFSTLTEAILFKETDKSNTYDNYLILRGCLWSKSKFKCSKTITPKGKEEYK